MIPRVLSPGSQANLTQSKAGGLGNVRIIMQFFKKVKEKR
jgi:hypothetical protein